MKLSSTSGRYSSHGDRITSLDKDYQSCDALYDDLKSAAKFASPNSVSDVRQGGRY